MIFKITVLKVVNQKAVSGWSPLNRMKTKEHSQWMSEIPCIPVYW